MSENTPFQNIFQQYLDLLQFALEKSNTPIKEIPADLPMRLHTLEKQVEAFCRLNESLLKAQGHESLPDPEAVIASNLISKSDKRLLERAKKLLDEAQVKNRLFSKIKEDRIAKGEKKPQKAKNPVLERKKGFKQIGGYKHWKPL